MLRNRLFIITVLLLALGLALGCTLVGKPAQAPEATQPPAQPTKAAEQPTPAPEKATPTPETEEVTPTPVPEEEELTLDSLAAGVEELSSYRARWTITFEGQDSEGNPVKEKMEVYEEYNSNPLAQRVVFKSQNLVSGETSSFEMIQVEDKGYMLTPDGMCVSGITQEEGTKIISPGDMGGVSGAKFVGQETVNGIKCKHYTFNEKAFLGFPVTQAKGDVWVAPEGYVVKFILEAQGKGEFLGYGKGEGKLRWEYEVTDVNKPVTVEIPEACLTTVPEDIPIMPGASETFSMGGMMVYSVEKPFDEVVKFYKTEMVARGWKPAEGSMEVEGMAMLNFAKGDKTAQVIINSEEGKVTVSISFSQ